MFQPYATGKVASLKETEMNALVEKSYFEQVLAEMQKNGFLPFSVVTMDLSDGKYHVPARVARDTRMFFWVEKMAVIIQLVYREHAWPKELPYGHEDIRGYWQARMYIQVKPYKKVIEVTATERWEDIPLFGENWRMADLEGFARGGGGGWGDLEDGLQYANWSWESEQGKWIDAVQLAVAVKKWAEQLFPVVSPLPFQELQVTDFPPHYTFPGCEEKFWAKFDVRNLRSLVKRPWGSTDLKR